MPVKNVLEVLASPVRPGFEGNLHLGILALNRYVDVCGLLSMVRVQGEG